MNGKKAVWVGLVHLVYSNAQVTSHVDSIGSSLEKLWECRWERRADLEKRGGKDVPQDDPGREDLDSGRDGLKLGDGWELHYRVGAVGGEVGWDRWSEAAGRIIT